MGELVEVATYVQPSHPTVLSPISSIHSVLRCYNGLYSQKAHRLPEISEAKKEKGVALRYQQAKKIIIIDGYETLLVSKQLWKLTMTN